MTTIQSLLSLPYEFFAWVSLSAMAMVGYIKSLP